MLHLVLVTAVGSDNIRLGLVEAEDHDQLNALMKAKIDTWAEPGDVLFTAAPVGSFLHASKRVFDREPLPT